jgi:malate dehydrogenase (oxaloacetate-decarboxylating)
MERYDATPASNGRLVVRVPHRGSRLLTHPMYNKSTAFTPEERIAFELEGLLPETVSTIDQQAQRIYENIAGKSSPLEKYIALAALQDRNEHLFFHVLIDHVEELLPIVYTPTVGLACQEYSHIFRRARGLWIHPGHKGRIEAVLGSAPFEDVRLIVATDNESILGIGDQGAGGMPIPIGKLALYTAAAGIHPAQTLPISLDVGTDNKTLLEDPLYVGWRQPRLRGAAYDALLDEFVEAVKRRFPKALLQWEDFRKATAFGLLDRYRKSLPSFNDDIQGTAAVTLAALSAAARFTGTPLERQRIVILGGGAAGVGIGRLLRAALARAGVGGEALHSTIAMLAAKGLLVDDDAASLEAFRKDLTWPAALAARRGFGRGQPRDLAAVVRQLKPTALIGVSGAPGSFTREIVTEMARHVERPVILPLSNPTSQSEALPEDLIAWTEGRALVASGSPFAPVSYGGRTIRIGQGNNAFIFPAIGMGAIVAEASEISEEMFAAAAAALAAQVSDAEIAAGSLYPPIARLREVTARVAAAVVREARDSGLGRAIADEDVERRVGEAMWEPVYPTLVPA